MEKESFAAGIVGAIKRNTMLIALLAVMLFFHFLIIHRGNDSGFFNPATITNLISQNAYVVVLATGMLLCILTGGNIDLSVGSIVALVGALAGKMMVEAHWNTGVSAVICLIAGVGIGAFHGFWIAYARIPPFIVTLAGMLLWRGVALIILNGLTISPFPKGYLKYFTSFIHGSDGARILAADAITIYAGIGLAIVFVTSEIYGRITKASKGYDLESFFVFLGRMILVAAATLYVAWLLAHNKGIPVVLITLAIVVLVYHYFTARTVPGRYLYAIGGNEKAARMSGINTKRMMFFAYTNMGFLAAVAALMCVARFNSASPSAGTSYELDAIAACFIGGASAYGGVGTVGGAVIGAIFMGVLNQGMSIVGVDANWQQAVKGLVLLAAVVFDVVSKKSKGA